MHVRFSVGALIVACQSTSRLGTCAWDVALGVTVILRPEASARAPNSWSDRAQLEERAARAHVERERGHRSAAVGVAQRGGVRAHERWSAQ